MERAVLAGGALLLLALIVSAAVFTYRGLSSGVGVAGASAARGSACVGFYSAVQQPAAPHVLPKLGSNSEAPTYGNNKVTVTPVGVICVTETPEGPVYLYENITVSVPITRGYWAIRDFYAIGYPSNRGGGTVYLYVTVDDIMGGQGEPQFDIAKLWFQRGSDGLWSWVDLRFISSFYIPLPLSPGDGYNLTLELKTQNTGAATFRMRLFFSHSQESP